MLTYFPREASPQKQKGAVLFPFSVIFYLILEKSTLLTAFES